MSVKTRESKDSSIKSRLDKHFVACAAVAAAGVAASSGDAQAAIQYSGVLNLAVNPASAAGIYINVGAFHVNTTAAADPAWNINLFNITYTGGYVGVAFYPRVPAQDLFVGTSTGIVSKLATGTNITGSGAHATVSLR